MIKNTLSFWIHACAGIVLVYGANARADAPQTPVQPVTLIHHALTAADLPSPQTPMVLKFALTNTHDLERPVRALVARDGRLIDVPLSKSYLDEKEQPTYEFVFNAPTAEIIYEFLAYDKNGGAITSQLFGLRRQCIPDLELVNTATDPNLQPEAQLQAMYAQSQKLGAELEAYNHVVKTIKNLDNMLKD